MGPPVSRAWDHFSRRFPRRGESPADDGDNVSFPLRGGIGNQSVSARVRSSTFCSCSVEAVGRKRRNGLSVADQNTRPELAGIVQRQIPDSQRFCVGGVRRRGRKGRAICDSGMDRREGRVEIPAWSKSASALNRRRRFHDLGNAHQSSSFACSLLPLFIELVAAALWPVQRPQRVRPTLASNFVMAWIVAVAPPRMAGLCPIRPRFRAPR
jgi:hypothetical protein